MFDETPGIVKAAALWATFAAAGMSAVGCRSEAEIAKELADKNAAAAAKDLADQQAHLRQVADLVRDAQSLVQDTAYVITLKMAKEELTLDPFTHLANDIKAQYRDVLVGEKEFNERQTGDILSSTGDYVGFLSDGSFAEYKVSVYQKAEIPSWRYVDSLGKSHEVSEDVFRDGLSRLASGGKSLYSTHAPGQATWTVSEDPISKDDITQITPLSRYYAQVRIANSSLSLSLRKQLTNAATQHVIQVEIPERVYRSGTAAFDSTTSDSFLVSGRISSLSGTIERRWSELDDDSVMVTLKDGRKIAMLKEELPQ